MSTLAVNTITDAVGGSTAIINGMTPTALSLQGFRNRIINGDMRIDQRNGGASVTPSAGVITYTLDRWFQFQSAASKFSVQRNAGSVAPPAGFPNYLGITSLSAYSPSASEVFLSSQFVEGFNIADFSWGTGNAVPVTVSFWIRSSLTGTFSFSVCNFNSTRNYIATYTVSSANTWEYKTITIPGDTTGTWLNDNGTGLQLRFDLGSGSSFHGTAGSWGTSNLLRTSGSQSVVGTNGATFYITGVQLEAGSVATPFERRDYGRELIMCQRYYWKTYNQSAVPGATNTSGTYRARSFSGTYAAAVVQFPVLMRTTPTCTLFNPTTGATNSWRDVDNNADRTASFSTVMDSAVATESNSVVVNTTNVFQIVASAEL